MERSNILELHARRLRTQTEFGSLVWSLHRGNCVTSDTGPTEFEWIRMCWRFHNRRTNHFITSITKLCSGQSRWTQLLVHIYRKFTAPSRSLCPIYEHSWKGFLVKFTHPILTFSLRVLLWRIVKWTLSSLSHCSSFSSVQYLWFGHVPVCERRESSISYECYSTMLSV